MINNVTIIIRSAGERTLEYCKYLLSRQTPQRNIVITEETPFSAAVNRSFQIGIERGLEWTLCIDADVLLAKDSVIKMVDYLKNIDNNVFEIQGLVRDKLFTVIRPAGNHLYRTKYLEKAFECVPVEGASLRPETDTLKEMARRGYPWMQTDIVVGIHDYEQYYSDLFRKAFIQAKKFREYRYYLENIWRKNSEIDDDYVVAMQALKLSDDYHGEVYINATKPSVDYKEILKSLNLQEKEALNPDNFNLEFPNEINRKIKTDEDNRAFERMIISPIDIKLGVTADKDYKK